MLLFVRVLLTTKASLSHTMIQNTKQTSNPWIKVFVISNYHKGLVLSSLWKRLSFSCIESNQNPDNSTSG